VGCPNAEGSLDSHLLYPTATPPLWLLNPLCMLFVIKFACNICHQSSQLFSTVSRTLLVYSLRLSLYRLDASTFAGDPVFGSLSKLKQNPSSILTQYFQRVIACTDL